VGEDVRDRELLLLALEGLGLVGCESRDLDQGGDAVVHARVRDQGPAIRVADENHGAADAPQTAANGVHVVLQRVKAVLGTHHLVPIVLQRRDQFLEA
jgi:hypothetical protein